MFFGWFVWLAAIKPRTWGGDLVSTRFASVIYQRTLPRHMTSLSELLCSNVGKRANNTRNSGIMPTLHDIAIVKRLSQSRCWSGSLPREWPLGLEAAPPSTICSLNFPPTDFSLCWENNMSLHRTLLISYSLTKAFL